MENKIKKKKESCRPTDEAGFIQIIIFIIIALLIMKYFGITISEAINWFKSFFGSILK